MAAIWRAVCWMYLNSIRKEAGRLRAVLTGILLSSTTNSVRFDVNE